ncbi:PIN domain-containing protein [Bordetella bronchialis]|uniref:Ribonuclease VapC n=1 Tax=Bordetella bronchialis TaxID=463025 RepID=A0A193FT64_9BORD|nr:PIN domain-containing protein [Bordetella bronchialis]ANN70942.1 pilus assembly protein [Bordetella bronchialis]
MSVSRNKVFIDSNVVLYLLSGDAAKADKSEELLKQRPTISVQVLNEVTSVCVRKLRMAWREVDDFLAVVKNLCNIVPVTIETHDLARLLAHRHGLGFYDACIVAAARLEGCDTLYTEDMHDGLAIDADLALRNPYA